VCAGLLENPFGLLLRDVSYRRAGWPAPAAHLAAAGDRRSGPAYELWAHLYGIEKCGSSPAHRIGLVSDKFSLIIGESN